MLKKIIGFVAKYCFPYWCAWCPRRYMTEGKYRKHSLLCEGRLMAMKKEEEMYRVIAPVNRKQRRKMAKKSGMIKDWGKLNAP